MIELRADIPNEVMLVLAAMSPRDIAHILQEVEGDALASGGVLEDHYREGQSSWRRNSPQWVKQKGTSEVLREEGALREAVRSPGHPNRGRRLTAGKGRLSIWLKRDEGGRNLYDMVQRGSLAALSFTGMDGAKRVIGAAEVIAERKRLSEEYRAWAVGALPARHLMDMRPEDTRRLYAALERAMDAWLMSQGG